MKYIRFINLLSKQLGTLHLDLYNFLNSIGSKIVYKKENQTDKLKEIQELSFFIDFYITIQFAYIGFYLFKSEEQKTGAFGQIPKTYPKPKTHPKPKSLKLVVLNHDLFGKNKISKKNRSININESEILVHEAGHNLASEFYHTKGGFGEYEYNQIGLQSNQSGDIYPTLNGNTVTIINNKRNRKNMTIL